MARVCPACGHENADEADFCGSCGGFLRWDPTRATPAVTPEEPAPEPEPEPEPEPVPGPEPEPVAEPEPEPVLAPEPVAEATARRARRYAVPVVRHEHPARSPLLSVVRHLRDPLRSGGRPRPRPSRSRTTTGTRTGSGAAPASHRSRRRRRPPPSPTDAVPVVRREHPARSPLLRSLRHLSTRSLRSSRRPTPEPPPNRPRSPSRLPSPSRHPTTRAGTGTCTARARAAARTSRCSRASCVRRWRSVNGAPSSR